MDTKYPANSLHNSRGFTGIFSIQINTALQCVSLGNVEPRMHFEQRENLPRKPHQCNRSGDELSNVESSPTDVCSGTHMAGRRAGHLRAHNCFVGNQEQFKRVTPLYAQYRE